MRSVSGYIWDMLRYVSAYPDTARYKVTIQILGPWYLDSLDTKTGFCDAEMKSMLALKIENHVTLDDLKSLDAQVNCDVTRYFKSYTLWISKLLGNSFNVFNVMMFTLRQILVHTVALRVENELK